MTRPTKIIINPTALLHNISCIREVAPGKKLFAMVKANAYGCGLSQVAPILDGHVDALGVACLEEALQIRAFGVKAPCILFQGVFNQEELQVVSANEFACVFHHPRQVEWVLTTPLVKPISVWIKVNTGMNRLGFKPEEVSDVVGTLSSCPWVKKDLGLMTHLACADEPARIENQKQVSLFQGIALPGITMRSIANSAAILSLPETHADAVRAGIMLYGVSPFPQQTGTSLGLKPVMYFFSSVSAIHHNDSPISVGYGATWTSTAPSRIGIVPVGYGDGYPRHIQNKAFVWIQGHEVPIVGRVSMDMLAIDLSKHPSIKIGDSVELWGAHMPVERVAAAAGTIAYELLCQITERPRIV